MCGTSPNCINGFLHQIVHKVHEFNFFHNILATLIAPKKITVQMYETTLPESVHHVGLGDSNSNVPNYSNIINENIIAIKLDLKFAKNNIENIDAQVVSKPIIESIRSTLQNIFDTVISTEKLFATWNKDALKSSDRTQLEGLESEFKKLVRNSTI